MKKYIFHGNVWLICKQCSTAQMCESKLEISKSQQSTWLTGQVVLKSSWITSNGAVYLELARASKGSWIGLGGTVLSKLVLSRVQKLLFQLLDPTTQAGYLLLRLCASVLQFLKWNIPTTFANWTRRSALCIFYRHLSSGCFIRFCKNRYSSWKRYPDC